MTKPKPKPQMASVKIPRELQKDLAMHAAVTGRKIQWMMTEAVRAYLRKEADAA